MELKIELFYLIHDLLGLAPLDQRKALLRIVGLSYMSTEGSSNEFVNRIYSFLCRNGQARVLSFLQSLSTTPDLNPAYKAQASELLGKLQTLTRAEWTREFEGAEATQMRGVEKGSERGSDGSGSSLAVNQEIGTVQGGNVTGVIMGGQYNITVGGEMDITKLITLLAAQMKPALPKARELIRLDVATPATVTVKAVFEIGVAIRQRQSPPLAVEDLTQVTSAEGEIYRHAAEDIIRYRVDINSPDCEIAKASYIFLLQAGTDSPVRYFQLTPQRTGLISIIVDAYQEDLVAASTRVRVEATVAAKSS